MLFSSYEFILLFLPLCWLLFRTSMGLRRLDFTIRVLTVCSLGFYAYWNPWHVPIILGSIVFNYLVSLRILRSGSHARFWLLFGVSANVLLIGLFKYLGFLIDSWNGITGSTFPVIAFVLPLGISFFTFQQIAYLVDTIRGDPPAGNLWEYALFVLFFPHLIAGPIVHPKVLLPQFRDPDNFLRYRYWLPQGVLLFSIGLFKKVVIADSLAPSADLVFGLAANQPGMLSWFDAWAGLLAYSLQIYFDFSGYSDMAIGLGMMFGIVMPINFNSPYQATSIIDFWRRWHMTLSAFLRDYLYIALGGNRRGPARRYVNLLATMLIGGLWHGANWTFVLWGGIHGAALAANHAFKGLSDRASLRKRTPAWISRPLGWFATMFLVCMAWVLFRSDSPETAFDLYRTLLSGESFSLPRSMMHWLGDGSARTGWRFDGLSPQGVFANPLYFALGILGLVAVVLFVPNASGILARTESDASGAVRIKTIDWLATTSGAIFTAIVFVIGVLALGRVQAFLYFQF